MTRLLTLAAAALVSTALLSPIAAQAGEGPYYAATPVAAPTKTTLIAGDSVWKWNNTAFTAASSTRRDSIMCELVVKNTGKLSAFSADGKAFDEAALAKCNARAK